MKSQSSNQSQNIVHLITQKINQHKRALILGLGLGTLFFGYKIFASRVHPDIKKVLKLRRTIQEASSLSVKNLQNLKIQKRILTNFGKSFQDINNAYEINMEFLLITRLKFKQANKQEQLRNPFLPPFEEGIFISELEPSHRLIYNKYNIYENHLIIITKQFEVQTNELNEIDFKQVILVVKALEGLLFFNCGKDAGSSQPHKHIQVFPRQALHLPIIIQIQAYVENLKEKQNAQFFNNKVFQFPGFNFIHGFVILEPKISISQSKKSIYKAYKLIMEQTVYRIHAQAYNVIGTQSFIMVIPRRKQKAFNEIAINSVGFMGSILFKDEERLNKYLSLRIKPSSILEDITYPNDYKPNNQMIQQKPQLKQ